jgi:hypothetical protein
MFFLILLYSQLLKMVGMINFIEYKNGNFDELIFFIKNRDEE